MAVTEGMLNEETHITINLISKNTAYEIADVVHYEKLIFFHRLKRAP